MKRIFCDMDDTLCDFTGPFKSGEYKLKFPQSKLGFFLDLEPLEGAIEGMKTLQTKYNVYILTRPSIKNTNCYAMGIASAKITLNSLMPLFFNDFFIGIYMIQCA